MLIDAKQIITVTESKRNFAKAMHIADENGVAIIFVNNKPKYKLINLEAEPDLDLTDDENIDIVARRVMERFKPAFMELAK